jgi:hypothetical protein
MWPKVRDLLQATSSFILALAKDTLSAATFARNFRAVICLLGLSILGRLIQQLAIIVTPAVYPRLLEFLHFDSLGGLKKNKDRLCGLVVWFLDYSSRGSWFDSRALQKKVVGLERTPLWSSGQSSWLQMQGSRVRFPGTKK